MDDYATILANRVYTMVSHGEFNDPILRRQILTEISEQIGCVVQLVYCAPADGEEVVTIKIFNDEEYPRSIVVLTKLTRTGDTHMLYNSVH